MSERGQSRQWRSTDALLCRADDAVQRALGHPVHRQLHGREFPFLNSTDPSMGQGCWPDPSASPTALIADSLSFAASVAPLRERALTCLLGRMDGQGLRDRLAPRHGIARPA